MATDSIVEVGPAQEVVETGTSSITASIEEPRTDEAIIEVDVVMGGAEEERHVAASEAVEEPTLLGLMSP